MPVFVRLLAAHRGVLGQPISQLTRASASGKTLEAPKISSATENRCPHDAADRPVVDRARDPHTLEISRLPISEIAAARTATMAAKEAAEAGRANYKNGDYKAAALCFTEALEDIDAEDTHKLYSNRSACRMHLHDFKGAKEDAESCTALKPSWAKGWARLGAAQGRLGEITEAVASYEKAHELDPTEGEYEREAAKLATPRPRDDRRLH